MPTVDPYWNSAQFLLQPSGAPLSTVFTDIKGHAITSSGNVMHATAPGGLFGGTCAYFDGSGDQLRADSSDFSFGTDDWTIEFFFNSSINATIPILFALRSSTDTWTTYARINSNKVQLFVATASGTNDSILSTNNVSTNAWSHLAISRVGSTIRAYLNGVIFASNLTNTANLPQTKLTIGDEASLGNSFQGYIDEFRITNGVGRYSDNGIVVPTEPYPAIGARFLGTVRDENGILCARTVRAYDRASGALIGSTVSDGVTGAFELYSANDDAQTVIVLDDETGTSLNALIYDRVTPELIV